MRVKRLVQLMSFAVMVGVTWSTPQQLAAAPLSGCTDPSGYRWEEKTWCEGSRENTPCAAFDDESRFFCVWKLDIVCMPGNPDDYWNVTGGNCVYSEQLEDCTGWVGNHCGVI